MIKIINVIIYNSFKGNCYRICFIVMILICSIMAMYNKYKNKITYEKLNKVSLFKLIVLNRQIKSNKMYCT